MQKEDSRGLKVVSLSTVSQGVRDLQGQVDSIKVSYVLYMKDDSYDLSQDLFISFVHPALYPLFSCPSSSVTGIALSMGYKYIIMIVLV